MKRVQKFRALQGWKKNNYFYPPKAKDMIGKASEVEVPSKTFQPNTFPTSGNQNEASGNSFM